MDDMMKLLHVDDEPYFLEVSKAFWREKISVFVSIW
jgi:hypothetical protein